MEVEFKARQAMNLSTNFN